VTRDARPDAARHSGSPWDRFCLHRERDFRESQVVWEHLGQRSQTTWHPSTSAVHHLTDALRQGNGRLEEIRDNLIARITEAEREGWLGEVEGLRVSLTDAKDKLAQLDALVRRTSTAVQLGMPIFDQIAGGATR
jgi:hypothetical protein